MIAVHCSRCGSELSEPGAILFGPPRSHEPVPTVKKRHLCEACYLAVLGSITPFSPTDQPPRGDERPDPTRPTYGFWGTAAPPSTPVPTEDKP